MSAPVTRHAIGEIAYAFTQMLGANFSLRMLMTSVASGLAKVAGRMACGAGHIMVFVESKILCVIECGGFPSIRTMALRALRCRACVNCGAGYCVAGHAIFPKRRAERCVSEDDLAARRD